jgi:hypothetical protein
MDRIWVAPPFLEGCQRLRLCSAKDFAQFFGMQEQIGRKDVRLVRKNLQFPDRTVEVWYKQYDYPPNSWRYAWRISKARREYLSYAHMIRLGVQCATPLACGEERDALRRLRRAFIVTVSIPDAKPLAEFVKESSPDPEAREMILRDLALMTRRAHDGGFIHRDLWVRNILVNWESPGRPGVWWIDSPKGAVWRWLTRFGKVLDLASLNKGAIDFSTRTERLRFLKEYLGDNQNGQLKTLARKVLQMRMR